MKKELIILLFLIGAIVLTGCSRTSDTESNSVLIAESNQNALLLEEGLQFIREGQYEEGLTKCDQMSYGRGTCYLAVVGSKEKNGEQLTEELCNSIPIEKGPDWDVEGKSEKILKKAKEDCINRI